VFEGFVIESKSETSLVMRVETLMLFLNNAPTNVNNSSLPTTHNYTSSN